jgi:hypothetical protein
MWGYSDTIQCSNIWCCLQEVDAEADCGPTKAPEVTEDFQYDEAVKIQIKELNLTNLEKLIYVYK